MNQIIIELCAEDRARLDRLTEALEKNVHNCAGCVQSAIKMTQAIAAPAEEPKNEPQESIETETPATPPAEEEKPAEVKETAPAEEVKPTVTLAQIQQKVVQLCAGFNGTKKAAVREIVNAYAKKVSDLPEDKWVEIWDKLTALESEE